MKRKQLSIRKLKRQGFKLPLIKLFNPPKDFDIDEFVREWVNSPMVFTIHKTTIIKHHKPFIDYFKKPKYKAN